ncbi:hypothetical protein J3458_003495 [Metarhizium acridum]|uniref:uncharacterized protein n=1 Tax=Metarhizium acridum TaxID=92637 RepID=UPI001C6CF516|nr:hypothetical protein J3458_003495 [Metarhizium acridum]
MPYDPEKTATVLFRFDTLRLSWLMCYTDCRLRNPGQVHSALFHAQRHSSYSPSGANAHHPFPLQHWPLATALFLGNIENTAQVQQPALLLLARIVLSFLSILSVRGPSLVQVSVPTTQISPALLP